MLSPQSSALAVGIGEEDTIEGLSRSETILNSGSTFLRLGSLEDMMALCHCGMIAREVVRDLKKAAICINVKWIIFDDAIFFDDASIRAGLIIFKFQ